MSETLPTHNGIPNIEIEPTIREWVCEELDWAALFVANMDAHNIIKARIELIKNDS